jgi:hypothetical protein
MWLLLSVLFFISACSARPKYLPGINFVRMLSGEPKPLRILLWVLYSFLMHGETLKPYVFGKSLEHEEAFDILYCIAFEMMDAQWLAMRASYMQFNVKKRCVFHSHSSMLCHVNLNKY